MTLHHHQLEWPRVGIPWRTSDEEAKAKESGIGKTKDYVTAVKKGGGEPVLVPLKNEGERNRLIPTLDAFLLPGSPADVDPVGYQAKNLGNSRGPDEDRENTDRGILELAIAQKRPVLAICYGFQMLNVHQKGSLIQDIRAQLAGKIANLERHRKQDPPSSTTDPVHFVTLDQGSRLAALAGSTRASVNSSHHQAIDEVGHQLRIVARAPDGIIEGVEWTGDANWIVGVQWHPERMQGDAFAERLFGDFVAAARAARSHSALATRS